MDVWNQEKANNYPLKVFLDLDKEANLLAFFLWILAMFGFQKWVFEAGGKGGCDSNNAVLCQ